MPAMNGVANLKTYFFPNVFGTGSLLYIPKDSLVYVNLLVAGINRRSQVYFDRNGQSNHLFGAQLGKVSPSITKATGSHIGNFVPAGTTILYANVLDVANIYLYVIELDNDEPNA